MDWIMCTNMKSTQQQDIQLYWVVKARQLSHKGRSSPICSRKLMQSGPLLPGGGATHIGDHSRISQKWSWFWECLGSKLPIQIGGPFQCFLGLETSGLYVFPSINTVKIFSMRYHMKETEFICESYGPGKLTLQLSFQGPAFLLPPQLLGLAFLLHIVIKGVFLLLKGFLQMSAVTLLFWKIATTILAHIYNVFHHCFLNRNWCSLYLLFFVQYVVFFHFILNQIWISDCTHCYIYCYREFMVGVQNINYRQYQGKYQKLPGNLKKIQK